MKVRIICTKEGEAEDKGEKIVIIRFKKVGTCDIGMKINIICHLMSIRLMKQIKVTAKVNGMDIMVRHRKVKAKVNGMNMIRHRKVKAEDEGKGIVIIRFKKVMTKDSGIRIMVIRLRKVKAKGKEMSIWGHRKVKAEDKEMRIMVIRHRMIEEEIIGKNTRMTSKVEANTRIDRSLMQREMAGKTKRH